MGQGAMEMGGVNFDHTRLLLVFGLCCLVLEHALSLYQYIFDSETICYTATVTIHNLSLEVSWSFIWSGTHDTVQASATLGILWLRSAKTLSPNL